MNEQMQASEESILHTYNRFPVVFERGEGCYLYDTEGLKYLDFAAGIAVNALGYHYPGYDEALKAQVDKLTHISNLYYNVPMTEAGEKLVRASGMSKAFFQSHRLNHKNFLTPLLSVCRTCRNKGRRVDPTGQPGFLKLQVK